MLPPDLTVHEEEILRARCEGRWTSGYKPHFISMPTIQDVAENLGLTVEYVTATWLSGVVKLWRAAVKE